MKAALLSLATASLLFKAAAFTALPLPTSSSNLRGRHFEPAPTQLHAQLDTSLMEFLGSPSGLAETFQDSADAYKLRIWLVDDSGSMASRDGHRMVATSVGSTKMASCTRWKELQETVDFHAQLSGLLKAPTMFRLINDADAASSFAVAWETAFLSSVDKEVKVAQGRIKEASPGGLTPLTERVEELHSKISSMAPTLSKSASKVCLVLATDGLPTISGASGILDDTQGFVKALRALQGLPVWLIVRLCTDEDAVVEFYNQLDSQLEMDVEVLDDFVAEAKEVNRKNPWLNYALPLHRLRETGAKHRVFDLLDERRLSKDELLEFCLLLFGNMEIPDPEVDWLEFTRCINEIQDDEIKPWNPLTKRNEVWVDLNKFKG